MLHLKGELDGFTTPELVRALADPVSRGGVIGLDVAELTFMDSTGIHALLAAAEAVGTRGRVVVFRPTPTVRRLIDLCGVGAIIDIGDDPTLAHPNGHNGDQPRTAAS
jgi:anti-anti-sigma factor